jgi:hypothetical protein
LSDFAIQAGLRKAVSSSIFLGTKIVAGMSPSKVKTQGLDDLLSLNGRDYQPC